MSKRVNSSGKELQIVKKVGSNWKKLTRVGQSWKELEIEKY